MKFDIFENGKLIATKEFHEGSYRIGRNQDCDICLSSTQVSKNHALLVIKGDKAAIVDTGSSNGVFVNGVLVKKQRFESKDEVAIAEFRIRFANPNRKSAEPPPIPPLPGFDGNLALNIAFEQPSPNLQSPQPQQSLNPQEKLLLVMDQKVLKPFYSLLKKFDWRIVLASTLMLSLVLSVLLSVVPILRWGKSIATKEALSRAHTVVAQVVRENYRIITKTNEYTRLTVEAGEAEEGVIGMYIVEPKSKGIFAPSKLYNTTLTGIYELIAIKQIVEGTDEVVSLEKEDGTYVVAQPIFTYQPSRNLVAVVIANFKIPEGLYSTFEPLVEAMLLSLLLSLIAYFLILKMVSYPVIKMQEQLDSALKGEDVQVNCESKFEELQTLAKNINFSISRWRQAEGGAGLSGLEGDNTAEEDAAYVESVKEFDQATSDAILLMDRNKIVVFVGSAFEELLGMRNQYAVGQNISDCCRDPSFAGTAIEIVENVVSNFGKANEAALEINGVNRNVMGVGHKNSKGSVSHVLVVVKLNG